MRNKTKAYIIRQGMTMYEVVDLLADVYGWGDPSQSRGKREPSASLVALGEEPQQNE